MASIRQRNGSWVADIRRKGHKSISKSFKTKSLALAWAREIEASIDVLAFKDIRSLTGISVEKVIDRYLTEIVPLAPIGRTKETSLKYWKKLYGNLSLAELTEELLTTWAHNRAKTVKGPTIQVDLAHLGTVLRVAQELWKLPIDLTATSKAAASLKYIGISKKTAERDRRPTQKEIDDICLWFTTKVRQKVPMESLILFAIETAMRQGEILNLRWDDIDHDNKTILIRDRKHPTQKVGNNQEVPLLGTSYDILMAQPRLPDEPLIFPGNPGTPSSLFPRACKALGIEDLRFHDLRHEGISRLFEKGYRIEQVALISGHRSWKMLSRYVQLKAKDLHNIMAT